MCYNLGADVSVQTMTPQQQRAAAPALNYGDLYQWARGEDGHQLRTSGNTGGMLTVNAATGQPATPNNRFRTFSNYGADWRTPAATAATNPWNAGTDANPSKGVWDPCPAGWRVPTDAELNALTNTSLNTRTWQAAGTGTAGYYVRPANFPAGTETLFLPAAGYRHIEGWFDTMGRNGHYWSSTSGGVGASYLYTSDVSFNMKTYFRAGGISVRCVAE
jgi:uncharacterized protein (TIGR02145 family)